MESEGTRFVISRISESRCGPRHFGIARRLLAWRHVAGEPLYCADKYVAAVDGIDEAVALVGVDDQLRGHMTVAQRVPELVRLGRGTLSVAVSNHHQGGRVRLLDEFDGRALGVDCGVVVNRGAEVRNHPLIDGVFAVIAFPV